MAGVSTHLEVVRQLSSPNVARVHGDEDPTGVDKADVATLKQEAGAASAQCVLNG